MDDHTGPTSDPMPTESLALGSPVRPLAGPVPDFPVQGWDRYEFLAFLGQGGMGKVFLARDRVLGREVAIKFIKVDDGRHLDRFMVESRAQARVDHAHVCKVFEVGEVEGKVYITMQHIKGAPLDAAAKTLTLEQKVLVLRDAALGVHEAHRAGIIHRDLKPSNIMVARKEDGSLDTYVMDFGLARDWNQDVTETGSVLGTPSFMSPEQARGEVSGLDRRTDVYSLGATLYQVLTGRPPVSGANPLEVLTAVSSEEVRPLREHGLGLPRDLEAITFKCLEKDRRHRYASARALAEDLDRFLAGDPVLARPTGVWYRLQRRLRKHRELTAVGSAALLVVLVALGTALRTRRDAGRRERLAQRFTESMARVEALSRYSALAPLHDIRPDLQAVQVHMAQLQRDMAQAGALANGPGHYALGQAFATLDDYEKAREHLQMAWDAGFREPRAAYALAVVIGRQYQERLLEAERIRATDQREARLRELDATLRAPALAFLRQAQGADAPSPAYLQALMAFYEDRLDEALERLRTLTDQLPWFYEAPLLRGTLLQARAWRHWNQGEREAAQADFDAGRAALLAAAACARSAPGVHAALAALERNALTMEKYGQGRVDPVFARGMAAVHLALAAQPDHVPSLILKAALEGDLADFRSNRGEKVDALIQDAVADARQAVAAGPARADARAALGRAYYQWGSYLQDQNLDPTAQLSLALETLASLSPGKRDYTVENHLGLSHQTWSDFDLQHGRDPSAHLGEAILAYGRATAMEPHLLPAWINLGTCLWQRAVLPRAADAEGDLQAAMKVLDQAHTLNPRHFVPCFMRAKVFTDLALLHRQGGGDAGPELQLAVGAADQGLAITAAIPHLHNAKGLALLEQARDAHGAGRDPGPWLAKARASFAQAIKVAPDQMHGYLNLGDLLLWQARWTRQDRGLPEAERLYRKALATAPGSTDPLADLGRLEAVRLELRPGTSPAPGAAWLAKALALDPRNRNALQYLGELRAAAARSDPRAFTQAETAFQGALDAFPGSQETLLALARLHGARAAWERATGRDPAPSLMKGRAILADLLKARPRWGEALALEKTF